MFKNENVQSTEGAGIYASLLETNVPLNAKYPNVDPPQDQLPAGHSGYGTFVAYCFNVNYILGVGVLGMPYAFAKAGYILSPIVLAVVTFMAVIGALWMPDVLARAEALVSASESEHEGGSTKHFITYRKFEMNQLVSIFLGNRMKIAYEICICIYFVFSLWSYVSVFAQSFASHVPIWFINNGDSCDVYQDHSSSCNNLYLFYIAIFAIVCIPLTCMDLTEMKGLQVFLAAFRFVSIGVMVITSISAILSYPNPELPAKENASAPYLSDAKAFSFSGLPVLVPIAIFSQIFHHSVPGIAQPIHDKNKIPKIFSGVLCTTWALYATLGLSAALYYGSSARETCTLNWADYTGGRETRPWWAAVVSYLVVLFPPIDITSAFPLNAITLSNTMMTSLVKDPVKRQYRRYRLPFRLMSGIVPCLGAILVHDLGTILTYSGCVGVFIAFIFPAMLEYRSKRDYSAEFGAGQTLSLSPNFTILHSDRTVYAMVGLGLLSFIGVVVFSAIG